MERELLAADLHPIELQQSSLGKAEARDLGLDPVSHMPTWMA